MQSSKIGNVTETGQKEATNSQSPGPPPYPLHSINGPRSRKSSANVAELSANEGESYYSEMDNPEKKHREDSALSQVKKQLNMYRK